MASPNRALVSAKWLADAVRNGQVGPRLRILDSSWLHPKLKRDTRQEFGQRHIPGSSFFDIDECVDKSSPFDNMLPPEAEFARYVGAMGIGGDTHVVVYDCSDFGAYTAPRVWWMFRVFGHDSVSVLDGGLKNWLAEGHPVTSEETRTEPGDFTAVLNPSWVKSFEEVRENVKTRQVQVVDARSAGRFRGTEPEPREDILPGHFPGAVNMPFTSFLDPSGKQLPPEEMSQRFKEAGVDLEKPLWCTCGSGVTACQVVLAAHLLGHPGPCVYDGSWGEWFQRAAPELILTQGKTKPQ